MRTDTRKTSNRQRAGLAAAGLGALLIGRQLIERQTADDLTGQTALVTGGSRGLGFLLAREFAREGCKIVICARDEPELERARAELEQTGAEVLSVPCDISDRGQVEQLIETATARFGQIDILVNNAGIIQVGPAETMTVENFEDAMGSMFWGGLYATMAVLPSMIERRAGQIVNITSIGGKVSVPHLLPYNAAKFAAVGFSEGLGAEMGRHNIQVTTVVPGLMRTGSFLHAEFQGELQKEYELFAPLSSLPLISMDAERAAREIVWGVRRGDVEITLSPPANMLAWFHGLFPGTTIRLFSLVNRVLPKANGGTTAEPGMDIDRQIDSEVFDRLTAWGRSAADRFNERFEPLPPSSPPPASF
jgi:NAD(P)-dependent dehydrogenase (short-subunit alcohol dehydrogenase family)